MTTSELMQLLFYAVSNIAADADLALASEQGEMQPPAVHKYFLPPRNKKIPSRSYIVVQLGKEKQDLQQDTDESEIGFQIVLGVYNNSSDLAEGLDILVSYMERLEIKLKNIRLLGGVAELKTIEKNIHHEQPIPYFEGIIQLNYSYYKPVLLPEP